MIRLFHVYLPGRILLLAASEGILTAATMFTAAFLALGADAKLSITYEGGLLKFGIAVAVCMLSMYYHDLYDVLLLHSPGQVMPRLIRVLGTVCLVLAVLYYLWPAIELKRNLLFTWLLMLAVFLAGARELFLALNRSSHFSQRVLFLGDGPLAGALAREIEQHPQLGLKVVSCVGEPGDECKEKAPAWSGDGNELIRIVENLRVTRLIVTMKDRRGNLPLEALLHLKAEGVRVEDAADLYEAITGRVPVASLRLSWLLFSDGFRISHPILIYKRALSLGGSVLGLLLAWPLMLLIAIAIKLDSPGPVIFRQARAGKDRRLFTLYKYRSMYQDADETRPAEANDRRCTRVGRWLRRTRLDELPQLWNILRGDMYFIGPRPFLPNVEDDLARQIPFYSQRWAIKPGATGWAQVQRGYCVSVEDNVEKLGYDLFYIKNISVGLDFLILFQTSKILLLGRGGQ